MLVFLQKRILPSAWGTVMASLRTEFTQKTVPVSAFSGRPPSAGGLKRGSRQVPVQVGGSAGSITPSAFVFFLRNQGRYGGVLASVLCFPRGLPETSFARKKATI